MHKKAEDTFVSSISWLKLKVVQILGKHVLHTCHMITVIIATIGDIGPALNVF
jgi:hypothetical protein